MAEHLSLAALSLGEQGHHFWCRLTWFRHILVLTNAQRLQDGQEKEEANPLEIGHLASCTPRAGYQCVLLTESAPPAGKGQVFPPAQTEISLAFPCLGKKLWCC